MPNGSAFPQFTSSDDEQHEANKTERQEPGFVMRTPDQRIEALEKKISELNRELEDVVSLLYSHGICE